MRNMKIAVNSVEKVMSGYEDEELEFFFAPYDNINSQR